MLLQEDMEKMPHADSTQLKWRLWLIALMALFCWTGGADCRPAANAQGQLVHIVQAGESLYRIAIRYGTTVEAIVIANNLANPDQILEGQRLSIPESASNPLSGAAATTGGSYVVQEGDTLLYIALRYGLRVSELRQANGLFGTNLLSAGQMLVIPGAGGTVPRPGPTYDTYIVQYGDTLAAIAREYFVDAFALAHIHAAGGAVAARIGCGARAGQAHRGGYLAAAPEGL